MSKVYYLKDMRLISNSNIIEEHPKLAQIFDQYPELTKRELKLLPTEIQLFFRDIYSKVLNQAKNEWEIDMSFKVREAEKNEVVKCELCSHRLKFIFQIKNKLNHKIMKVGSFCLKHFDNFNSEIDPNKLLEESKYISRIEQLNYKIPGLEDIISTWNKFIDGQPIYINKNNRLTYCEILYEVKTLFDEYFKKNLSTHREIEIIEEISKLLIECNNEKQKILNYVNVNKDNKLMPTPEVIKYLEKNGDNTGLEWVDKEEIIKKDTLYRIKEENFVKALIPEFNLFMKDKGITLKSIKYYKRNIGYSIVLEKNINVELFCNYEKFAMDFGGIITKEEIYGDISQKAFINMGQLIDEDSIDYALTLIESILKNYSIEIMQFFYNYDDILWKKTQNGDKAKYYILTKLNNLKDTLKELIYNFKKYTPNELYDIITENSSTLGNSEAEDLIKNRNR